MLQNRSVAVLFVRLTYTFLVADMLKGMTPEEIRRTFGIKNDFSPEEQEKIRKENAW